MTGLFFSPLVGRKCCQREASSATLCRRGGFLRQLVQSEVAFSFIPTFLSHTPSILLPRVHVMLLFLFILSPPLAIFLPVCVEGFILLGILESFLFWTRPFHTPSILLPRVRPCTAASYSYFLFRSPFILKYIFTDCLRD